MKDKRKPLANGISFVVTGDVRPHHGVHHPDQRVDKLVMVAGLNQCPHTFQGPQKVIALQHIFIVALRNVAQTLRKHNDNSTFSRNPAVSDCLIAEAERSPGCNLFPSIRTSSRINGIHQALCSPNSTETELPGSKVTS